MERDVSAGYRRQQPKGGGFHNDVFKPIALAVGTVSYWETINSDPMSRGRPFPDAAATMTRTTIKDSLHAEAEPARALLQRNNALLIGGIVWAMATYTHPDKQLEDRPKLSHQDIADFKYMVETKGPTTIASEVLGRARETNNDQIVKLVHADIAKIQNEVFPDQNQLIAGAHLLAAVSEEFNLKNKDIEFFRHPQSWLLGFTLDKSGEWK
jgi:hypothetical protein